MRGVLRLGDTMFDVRQTAKSSIMTPTVSVVLSQDSRLRAGFDPNFGRLLMRGSSDFIRKDGAAQGIDLSPIMVGLDERLCEYVIRRKTIR